jgi:phenylpropionate dioxygenase-like ring-hydroxylating dioxygenase large terminal subunit
MSIDPVVLNDWHPVAHVDDIADGAVHAVTLLDTDVVLWRSSDGLHAWEDKCAHRGVKLSLGSVCNNRLVCAYHGWEYQGDGQCVHYPAHRNQQPTPRARASTYQIKQAYGLVWVSLGEPEHDVPAFPEADEGTHSIFFGGSFAYDTSGLRAVENFLDISHFPFVHDGFLGDREHTEMKDYDVCVDANGVAVTNARAWQPKPTNSVDVDGMEVGYEYYVHRPFTARLKKDIGVRRGDGVSATEAIVLSMTPVAPDRSIGWALLASNYDELYSDDEVKEFTKLIIGQDVRIVESQRPKLLPTDMGGELHLPSDRTAVEYRRWINSLGLKYGTTEMLHRADS